MRFIPILLAFTVAGCSLGGDDQEPASSSAAPSRQLNGAQVQAPPPETSGALAQVADSPQAQERLAYVNEAGLARADLPFSAQAVRERVLGPGARAQRGESLVSVGVDRSVAGELADTAPPTSAITPGAQSAVQSCLGNTLAQTILGPGTMGPDAALGVGLAESGDEPAGVQLRICGAPKFIRHIHATERTLERRFGELPSVIEEREIGEREIIAGVVAADALPPRRVLRLLSAGPELRALAWR
jgi:hypothetical protein